MKDFINIIDTVRASKDITCHQLEYIFSTINDEKAKYLYAQAREVCENVFHKAVYLRGLIEFTNYCKNDCYYCGIRRSNKNAAERPTPLKGRSEMRGRGSQ